MFMIKYPELLVQDRIGEFAATLWPPVKSDLDKKINQNHFIVCYY